MTESLSDATLLQRFVSGREDAAFAVLVRRHGPRVERICRQILGDAHDAEDVLQATFLVLSLKADGIAWHDSVRPWLEGVARRLALHARSSTARRRVRERTITALSSADEPATGRLPERLHPRAEDSEECERRDLRRALEDELGRLPDKYRAPVVLCDLEGHTREEAARQLGWPTGSMSRRLDRGRSLLRQRLTVRGLALAALGVATITAATFGFRENRPNDPNSAEADALASHPKLAVPAIPATADGSGPNFDQVLTAAREIREAARGLARPDDEPAAPLWNLYAADLEHSAADLERAGDALDAVSVRQATLRIQASCLNCHAAFRVDREPSAFSPGESRPAAAPGRPIRLAGSPTARRLLRTPATTVVHRPSRDRLPPCPDRPAMAPRLAGSRTDTGSNERPGAPVTIAWEIATADPRRPALWSHST
ncbi:MAG: sigma-70 family RNA polymerase sigma factor [Isosphaeraceae bacterium]